MTWVNYDYMRDQREDEDFIVDHPERLMAVEIFTDEMAQLEAIADHRTSRQMRRIMEAQREHSNTDTW